LTHEAQNRCLFVEMNRGILAVILISLFCISCAYNKEENLYGKGSDCDTTQSRYSLRVSAIMQSHCTACHQPGFASAGIVLHDHSGVKATADNGKLLGSVKHTPGFSAMPQGGNKLSPCDILILEKWVSQGAPNN
jgi:cytochrome c5